MVLGPRAGVGGRYRLKHNALGRSHEVSWKETAVLGSVFGSLSEENVDNFKFVVSMSLFEADR